MPRNPSFYRKALRTCAISLAASITLNLTGCAWLQDFRDSNPGIQLSELKAPAGFKVQVLATNLPQARHLAMGTEDNLFVGSSKGDICAVKLNPAHTAALSQRVILTGLKNSSGVAFLDGSLFVADHTRILRFDGIEQRLAAPGPAIPVLQGLPDKDRHSAHAMGIGPDRKLYVSIGSPCDICEPAADEYGVIVSLQRDGSGKQVVARGIRNSVGFDWNPRNGELWFTDNGQDNLGIQQPNDELNHVTQVGQHFGFPYCHDANVPDAEFGPRRDCATMTKPALGLGPHVGALGMAFYRTPGNDSDTSIIVARHGSHPPTRVGYDVVRIRVADNGRLLMEPFLTGFLQGQRYWGRPVAVLAMKDGAVLISDDLNGAIYRVAPVGR